jgi:hypothetical protein
MKQLWEIVNFVRKLRVDMRFGELSRAPLQLLRLQLQGDTAECEWLARPPAACDERLPRHVRDHRASTQALLDAIALREVLFGTLPGLRSAEFRAYRRAALDEPAELIIAGTANAGDCPMPSVRSLAMRAKLCGLQFWLDDEGVLGPLLEEKGCFEASAEQVAAHT